jgi:aromatic ring hydroxylase
MPHSVAWRQQGKAPSGKKLARDAIGEQFGSRSLLYEWFFAGDPINNRILYYRTDTSSNCAAMAQAFLDSLGTVE